VKGSDRWVDGIGAAKWKVFGLIPVANAEGPDITRSAAGRAQIEGIWLPSALLNVSRSWAICNASRVSIRVRPGNEISRLEYAIDPRGGPQKAAMLR